MPRTQRDVDAHQHTDPSSLHATLLPHPESSDPDGTRTVVDAGHAVVQATRHIIRWHPVSDDSASDRSACDASALLCLAFTASVLQPL